MGYKLIIGDPGYSSWSLRAWLLFDRFGIEHTVRWVEFSNSSVAGQVSDLHPVRTVPAMQLPDGTVVWDSLAIAEELAARHPDAGLWPTDPSARATARSVTAEMHSGFPDLRADCPMNLRAAYSDFSPSDAVRADVNRIESIWAHARSRHGATGPWLFGDYCIADAFFAPVAARLAGYDIAVGTDAAAYVGEHLRDPSFRRWRSIGVTRGPDLPWYAKHNAQIPWPGPEARAASAVSNGPSVNTTCPYSGKPVQQYLKMDGKVYGFCNSTCRDKSVADPEAWPAFMNLVNEA